MSALASKEGVRIPLEHVSYEVVSSWEPGESHWSKEHMLPKSERVSIEHGTRRRMQPLAGKRLLRPAGRSGFSATLVREKVMLGFCKSGTKRQNQTNCSRGPSSPCVAVQATHKSGWAC